MRQVLHTCKKDENSSMLVSRVGKRILFVSLPFFLNFTSVFAQLPAAQDSLLHVWQQSLPRFAVGTNLLYDAAALTPNLSLEIGLSLRSTLAFSGSYNGWNRKGSETSNKKLVHSIFRADYRYWLCERFNGHFFGAGAIFTRYNVGQHSFFGLLDRAYRYDGTGYGGELTYGYHWMIDRRWGIEAAIGAGVVHFRFDKYPCATCSPISTSEKKTWLGPTNAAISLVYTL
ncbi:MAG: DUF3575 domain-containing protein [Prevotellaceae bacterium]|nr:DUF3575 domain-containing protein [Prevotellaceae bacterium]